MNIYTTRKIGHDEAAQVAKRFIDANFKNEGERPRIGIPARPDYDDDLVLCAFIEQQSKITAAARKLYFAGRWTAGLPAPLEARMWEDLRDALGLEPGAATAAGVHDDRLPAHGCPVCDDALECACEPPLPVFGEPTDADRERADAMLKAALARPGVEL